MAEIVLVDGERVELVAKSLSRSAFVRACRPLFPALDAARSAARSAAGAMRAPAPTSVVQMVDTMRTAVDTQREYRQALERAAAALFPLIEVRPPATGPIAHLTTLHALFGHVLIRPTLHAEILSAVLRVLQARLAAPRVM